MLGFPRDAHSAPLLEAIRLLSLESRRNEHIVNLVRSVLDERCHPELRGFFRILDTGEVTGDCAARIGVGKKRFRIHGALVYNQWMKKEAQGALDI